MSPRQNARSPSHGRRAPPPHARPTKPTLVNKKSPIKSSVGWSKSIGKQERSGKFEKSLASDEEDMAGFVQYCTTCEKQIVTPGSSNLYCSEKCRKKDNAKPLSPTSIPAPLSPQPRKSSSSYFDNDQYEIIPMRSPTIVRPPSLAFSDSSESSFFERPSYDRNESEAARYLAQFASRDSTYGNQEFRYLRYGRRHASDDQSSAPSLSDTPTSFASTAASVSSSRPLPKRTTPYSTSFKPGSVDLVTPVLAVSASSLDAKDSSLRSSASTSTTIRVAEGEMIYEKKPFSPSVSPRRGSLRQLFSHDAIAAPPKPKGRPTQEALAVEQMKQTAKKN